MSKKYFYLGSIALATTVLTAACTEDADCTMSQSPKSGVYAVFDKPEEGEALTRSIDANFECAFETGEMIQVFSAETTASINYTLTQSETDAKSTEFSLEQFNMKDGIYTAPDAVLEADCTYLFKLNNPNEGAVAVHIVSVN